MSFIGNMVGAVKSGFKRVGRGIGRGLKFAAHAGKTLIKNPDLIGKGAGVLASGIGSGLFFASGNPAAGAVAGINAIGGAQSFAKDFKKAYKQTKKSDKVNIQEMVGAYKEGKKAYDRYLGPPSGTNPTVENP